MALLCSTKLSVTDLLEPADMTQLTSLLLSARMTLYYIHYAGSLLHVGILAYASCKHVILPPVGRSIHRHAGSCSALGCLAPQSTLAPLSQSICSRNTLTYTHTQQQSESLMWLALTAKGPFSSPPPPSPATGTRRCSWGRGGVTGVVERQQGWPLPSRRRSNRSEGGPLRPRPGQQTRGNRGIQCQGALRSKLHL